MAGTKFPLPLTILAFAVSLALVILPGIPKQVQAHYLNSTLPEPSLALHWEVNEKFTPPSPGLSGRREAATMRCANTCTQGKNTVTAILPPDSFGVTVDAYPTFFWYLPESSAKAAEFVIVDENDQEIYSTTFAIAGNPGIFSFQLPASATLSPLEIGKKYHWYLALICNPQERETDRVVEGLIQRVEPSQSLVRELKQTTLRDRAAVYAKAGIWHETLKNLLELRCSRPDAPKLSSDWAELLTSVGLNKIAEDPSAQNCPIKN
jgi:hypothetical protein